MAIIGEWDEVNKAFDRLERYRVFHPALIAMRKLADMIQNDLTLADVQPVVSVGSLMLSWSHTSRRVMAAWNEDKGLYHIAFVDPPLEFSESTFVREDVVLRVLREYFDRLGGR